MKIIVATDNCGGIGKDGKIPWVEDGFNDFEFLRHTIGNSTCAAGWNTYKGIPKWLKEKTDVLLPEEYHTFLQGYDWVIGGELAFATALLSAEWVYHTIIPREYKCDRFFPVSVLRHRFDLKWQIALGNSMVVRVWRRK